MPCMRLWGDDHDDRKMLLSYTTSTIGVLSDHLPPLPDTLQAPPSLHTTYTCTHTKSKRDVHVEVGRL